MSKRRASWSRRCPKCRIQPALCFCGTLRKLANRTPVTIVMHHRERFLSSNTANLAQLTLASCVVRVRGLPGAALDSSDLLSPEHVPLYLFPDDDAVELTRDFVAQLDRPVQLIVPDGNWRQARKVKRREPGLSSLLSVRLPSSYRTRYRLRRSRRTDLVCTYEAIAAALGIVEDESLQHEMAVFLQTMVERTMHLRSGGRYADAPGVEAVSARDPTCG